MKGMISIKVCLSKFTIYLVEANILNKKNPLIQENSWTVIKEVVALLLESYMTTYWKKATVFIRSK